MSLFHYLTKSLRCSYPDLLLRDIESDSQGGIVPNFVNLAFALDLRAKLWKLASVDFLYASQWSLFVLLNLFF
jgi:hypothetical protein